LRKVHRIEYEVLRAAVIRAAWRHVKTAMPSEKAKDNKALVATCVACHKVVSTESMVSLLGRENSKYKQFDVCLACANGGWRPPGFEGIYTARPI
jgi:cytochrome c2